MRSEFAAAAVVFLFGAVCGGYLGYALGFAVGQAP